MDDERHTKASRFEATDDPAIEVDVDGTLIRANAAARALLAEGPRMLHIADPVERRAELSRAKRGASQLADAERIARIGIWEWDVPTGKAIWSDEIFRLFGFEPGTFEPSLERWLGAIHPDDRERCRGIVDEGYAAGKPFEFEHRVVRPDGTVCHVHCRGDVASDDAGEAIRVVGASQDVSQRVAQQEALNRIARQREAILDAAGEGICGIDPAGAITFVNPAAAEMLGRTIGALGGSRLAGFVRTSEGNAEPFAEALQAGEVVSDRRGALVRPDGSALAVDLLCTPIRQDDEVVGAVVTFNDATEQRRFEDQLAHLAHHDALTGLFNRRRFEQELSLQVSFSQRYAAELSVLLIDLDGFKDINDTHGHRVGDEVIRSVGRVLQERLRVNDVVARLGGDEFAVLLPSTSPTEALAVAETLRVSIGDSEHSEGPEPARITASIGVTTIDPRATAADDLLADADIAMYEAKDAGRNRIAAFDRQRRAQRTGGAPAQTAPVRPPGSST